MPCRLKLPVLSAVVPFNTLLLPAADKVMVAYSTGCLDRESMILPVIFPPLFSLLSWAFKVSCKINNRLTNNNLCISLLRIGWQSYMPNLKKIWRACKTAYLPVNKRSWLENANLAYTIFKCFLLNKPVDKNWLAGGER